LPLAAGSLESPGDVFWRRATFCWPCASLR